MKGGVERADRVAPERTPFPQKEESMSLKSPVGNMARNYASIQKSLPGIEMDPRIWGSKALDFLSAMAEAGPLFRQSAAYILEQEIRMYITKEARGVGAGWHEDLSGRRWISIDKSFGFVDSIIALGHEAHHLQQTIRVRCSVEGEYSAWRLGFKLRGELSSPGGAVPLTADEQTLAGMPDSPTREDLRAAQILMQKMAGPDYLIGKAPLQGKDWQTAPISFFVRIMNSLAGRGDPI
jgi:hypothetical protein